LRRKHIDSTNDEHVVASALAFLHSHQRSAAGTLAINQAG
jgi:hypothetical protein